MNTRLASLLLSAALLAGCQRNPAPADLEADRRREEQLRQMDERIAKLQDLEQQAADRKLAESEQRASTSEAERQRAEQDRAKAERERVALQKERDQLARQQKDAEARAREAERVAQQTAQQAEQERAERTIDLFYTALQPHGDWFEAEPYGYVWQPAAASDPRWRPYTNGRWVFTEYGWFWKSNEPFGWAAYHYGRWARLRRIGWVWVPGTEWGPAWVSWRRSDRYVGWAPLPPDAWSGSGFTAAVDSYYDIGPGSYTFVPVEAVGESTYVGRVVAPEQNVTIVNQTVNVTNITYKKVENNTVVYNAGPDITVVNARAAKKVPQLNVERVTQVGDPRDLSKSEQRGSTLVVQAPFFAKAKENERPRKVKESVKTPEYEKGWGDLDRAATDQARRKIKAEATEAEDEQRKPRPVTARPIESAAEKPAASAKPETPEVQAPATATPRREEKAAVKAKPASTPAVLPVPAPATPAATPAGDRRPMRRDLEPRESPAKAEQNVRATPPGIQRGEGPRERRVPSGPPATPPPADATPAAPVTPDTAPAKRGERKVKAVPLETDAQQAEETKVKRAKPVTADEPAKPPAADQSPAPAPDAEPAPTRRLPRAQKQRPADLPTSEDSTPASPAATPQPPTSKPEEASAEKPAPTSGEAPVGESREGNAADAQGAVPPKPASSEPARKSRDTEGTLKPFAPRPGN